MIYVTSDWHGASLSDVQRLFELADFGEEDFCFVLGDVIDRGEHGIELLKWLILQPNIELLLGNHESFLLACEFLFDEITDDSIAALDAAKMQILASWMANGAESTLKALRKLRRDDPELCRDIIDYLKDAPLYDTVTVCGREFLLCHTFGDGFEPDKRLDEYGEDAWLWSRPEPEDRFFDGVTAVIGHTPTAYYGREHSGRIMKTDTWIDIDTGGKLSMLRLDDMSEFYLE